MNSVSPRSYKSDRLTEVLCQINFDQPPGWNGTIYGIFFDAVKDLDLTIAEEVNVPMPMPTMGTSMIRYRQPNGPLLMQLSPNVFTVNTLGHYPGWLEFKQSVLRGCQKFDEVLPNVAVKSVGLRYINRFAFPNRDVTLAKWFTFYPTPPPIEALSTAFILREQWTFVDGHTLVVTLGSSDPSEQEKQIEASQFILELDYSMPVEEGWTLSRVSTDIETPHMRIYSAFESLITTNTRNLIEREGVEGEGVL